MELQTYFGATLELMHFSLDRAEKIFFLQFDRQARNQEGRKFFLPPLWRNVLDIV